MDGGAEPVVQLFRRLGLVGVVGLPGFWWIHRAADPAAINPFPLRALLGVLALVLLFATYRASERALLRLAYGLFYTVVAWAIGLLAVNDLSPDYALGMVVVATGLAGAFQDRRSLLFFQLFTLLGVVVAPLVAGLPPLGPPRIDPLILVTYALIMAVLTYLGVSVRLELNRKHRLSEEQYAAAAYGANDGSGTGTCRRVSSTTPLGGRACSGSRRARSPVSRRSGWVGSIRRISPACARSCSADWTGRPRTWCRNTGSGTRPASGCGCWRAAGSSATPPGRSGWPVRRPTSPSGSGWSSSSCTTR